MESILLMVKGDRINFLTMISDPISKRRKQYALFKCVCGRVKEIRVENVKIGSTKSCGCQRGYLMSQKPHNYKHGDTKTRIYAIYHKMKARCCNPNYAESQYYIDRGITICDEWLNSFTKFRDWAYTHGYQDNLSIDRINVNKGYSPDNCRWATPKQQSRNKRSNIKITFENKTKCLMEWCEELNLNYGAISARIKRGWDYERALSTPIKNMKGKKK